MKRIRQTPEKAVKSFNTESQFHFTTDARYGVDRMLKASLKKDKALKQAREAPHDLPCVSVVIPTLNEEKYLELTLRALKGQDYAGKIETIVADGGSSDRTVEIARRYADEVVTVEPGIARGRNAGAKAAEGKILLFLDADTVAIANTVSELVHAMERKDVLGATCPVLPMGACWSELAFFSMMDGIVRESIRIKKPHVPTMCVAYKREAFEAVGGFNEEMDTCEDLDLSQRIGKQGKMKFTDSTVVITSPRRIRGWGGVSKSLLRYGTFGMYYKITGNDVKIDKYKPVR